MSIWDFVLHYTKIYKTEVEQKNVPRQENQGDVHGRQQEQAAGPEGGSRSVTVRAGEVLKLQSGMLLLLWVGTQGYSHRESDSAGRILWHQCGLSAGTYQRQKTISAKVTVLLFFRRAVFAAFRQPHPHQWSPVVTSGTDTEKDKDHDKDTDRIRRKKKSL